MPYAFILAGLILLVSAVRGTQTDLFNLLKGDVIDGHFLWWIVAIFAVASVGYIKPLKPVSDAFLVLIILVLFLSNHGFFNELTAELSQLHGLQSASPFGGSVMQGWNPADLLNIGGSQII